MSTAVHVFLCIFSSNLTGCIRAPCLVLAASPENTRGMFCVSFSSPPFSLHTLSSYLKTLHKSNVREMPL